ATDAACHAALLVRPLTFISVGDLEQRYVGKAPVSVTLHGCQEARKKRGTHGGHVGGYRVGQLEYLAVPGEESRMSLGDERPGHRLHHAAYGQSPLGCAGA